MFAIIGASGNVGYSTSCALRQANLPVKAIVHEAAQAPRLNAIGCETVIVDLQDSISLANAITDAEAVQLILPFRPQTQDPAADLDQSMSSIIQALQHASVKRALMISDFGAHIAEDIGLPSVFRKFEAHFRKLRGQKIILRSAEHMHNWGRAIPQAIASGTLPSFQDPVDKLQPTIFAPDLGLISANLLRQPHVVEGTEVVHAEGPRRYSASDVAATISKLCNQPVVAQAIPRSEWNAVMSHLPVSLVDLLIKANDAKNRDGLVDVEPDKGDVVHGQTELLDGLRPLIPVN